MGVAGWVVSAAILFLVLGLVAGTRRSVARRERPTFLLPGELPVGRQGFDQHGQRRPLKTSRYQGPGHGCTSVMSVTVMPPPGPLATRHTEQIVMRTPPPATWVDPNSPPIWSPELFERRPF